MQCIVQGNLRKPQLAQFSDGSGWKKAMYITSARVLSVPAGGWVMLARSAFSKNRFIALNAIRRGG